MISSEEACSFLRSDMIKDGLQEKSPGSDVCSGQRKAMKPNLEFVAVSREGVTGKGGGGNDHEDLAMKSKG